ncbi:MAG: helix-turn-helix transcriptional regulator [Clostridia bacterium]|nr:helix-turn-helix transcriptional regulator [Clostridia bacterium]
MDEKKEKTERMKKIGEQIHISRKKCKYTRETLAEKSGISPNYLYNIEIGNKVPNVLIFLDLCQALDIPSGILLNPAVENRFHSFIEDISSDFNKLTNNEIALIKNTIHFLAKQK